MMRPGGKPAHVFAKPLRLWNLPELLFPLDFACRSLLGVTPQRANIVSSSNGERKDTKEGKSLSHVSLIVTLQFLRTARFRLARG